MKRRGFSLTIVIRVLVVLTLAAAVIAPVVNRVIDNALMPRKP